MYTSAAVHFRDPSRQEDSILPQLPTHTHPRPAWNVGSQYDFARSLTPPPEMSQGLQHPQHLPDHGYGYKYQPAGHDYKSYTSHATVPAAQELMPAYGSNGYASQANSRPMSPSIQSRQPTADSQSRRGSQPSVIAPSFQIPKSVNDSGGSLSELAAQITCLFWFESSDFLHQVEESPHEIQPVRQLVPDAKPTTGFRKWVTTILSTTLVAQNVVLLALLFIYRLKKLNPGVKGKPGSEYRLLTVALMLGNKFLDDNTYTNKTWAEVSGINVGEVHIMEVEFLSNMKYCLFTSAEEWKKWQQLLGRFASFFDRASRPPPILPPASSLNLPMALPSPPASNKSSPPYSAEVTQSNGAIYPPNGLTPAPSPLTAVGNPQLGHHNSRKRSYEDQQQSAEPPAKRVANGSQYQSPRHQALAQRMQLQPVPRLPLPSLQIPAGQAPSQYAHTTPQSQQLPPLTVPNRAMAMVYPTGITSQAQQAPHLMATSAGPSQPPSQVHSQYQSRQQSPYPGSGPASPTEPGPQPSQSTQISPNYFLQQRSSPYRPVHNVSTLLYPPPSAAMHQRMHSVELNQMSYQPLGRPTQLHTGRLPYVLQNYKLADQQTMTPVHQWPGFPGHRSTMSQPNL